MMSCESTIDTTPVPLSERIASLQASQTKAGMAPVEVHPTSRRMSEEKRLARRTGSTSDDVSRLIKGTDYDIQFLCISPSSQSEVTSTSDLQVNKDSTTTYVLESGPSDPYMSDSQDSSTAAAIGGDPHQPEQSRVSVTVSVNANSNNDNDGGKFVTTTSLYVAAAPADVQTSSLCAGEGEGLSSELEGGEGERETVAQEKQNGTSRVEIVLHNTANSDSVTNDSCSTANPMPNVQPSDML